MRNLVKDTKSDIFDFDARKNKKCCYKFHAGSVCCTGFDSYGRYNYIKPYNLFKKSGCKFFQLNGVIYYAVIKPSGWVTFSNNKLEYNLTGEIV